ncbi:GntR family transcriptional regulator [Kribbella solani]|uniref:DNA-binding GntR family transcriptional regulator n=1 Tax=Kribbella solani TaxID=236067 RepID=A0A841DVZ7_9ACTN|nr:DNA-binding GntR family transcriptional regulator [Kribbella solani]
MAIDRDSAQPLHAQLADDIRRRIHTGEFAPGTKLPALRALTAEYAVAEMTIHAAIRELQREGLVMSSRGRGTFVSKQATVPAAEAGPGETSEGAQLTELRRMVEDLAERVESLEAHADKSTGDQPPGP